MKRIMRYVMPHTTLSSIIETNTTKVAIAMHQFLPLCFFLLLSLNTQPLLATEPEPVFDTQRNPLEPETGYFVLPLEGGGLTLGQTRNKTCPLDVIHDPSSLGTTVSFSAQDKLDYIPTLTDLTIDFQARTICIQSTVWRLSKEGSGFWFISTNGNSQDIITQFKIERLQGEHVHDIYSFKFCPSRAGVLCAPVGIFEDTDGTKVLAVGDNIEPYYVRFQKLFNDQEKKEDVSSV